MLDVRKYVFNLPLYFEGVNESRSELARFARRYGSPEILASTGFDAVLLDSLLGHVPLRVRPSSPISKLRKQNG